MKETYIEPKNTILALNVRDNVMQVGSAPHILDIPDPAAPGSPSVTSEEDVAAREVIINSPNAWEEW